MIAPRMPSWAMTSRFRAPRTKVIKPISPKSRLRDNFTVLNFKVGLSFSFKKFYKTPHNLTLPSGLGVAHNRECGFDLRVPWLEGRKTPPPRDRGNFTHARSGRAGRPRPYAIGKTPPMGDRGFRPRTIGSFTHARSERAGRFHPCMIEGFAHARSGISPAHDRDCIL